MSARRASRREARTHDDRFMARALALATRALGRTAPNPPVGAVFVRNGRIVGEGWTRPAGGPHAEIVALRQAGARARGADLYVTLEPCAHHGRTPPCIDALLPLDLRRVVIAASDPNPRVRGRSLRRLRANGVEVEVGLRGAEARELMLGHWSLVRRGRPWVMLKLAMSVDGRIATARGASRWITGAAARRLVHEWRGECDAVLVGAGTVRADDPRLSCRLPARPQPLRVVIAGRRALPRRARVARVQGAPALVFVPASGQTAAGQRRAGVETCAVRARGGRVDLRAVMRELGRRGLSRVIVEGGGQIAAAALHAGVVDEVAFFLAPMVIGGDGVAAVASLGLRALGRAPSLRELRVERLGRDLLVRGRIARSR